MPRTCVIIRKPTTTSAGVAASNGTTSTSGVRNTASRNRKPVTTLAAPVRAPLADAGGRFDVRRVGRRRRGPTRHGSERVDEQHPLHARQLALAVEQSGLRADPDDGAHGVEEVGEHEGEDQQDGGDKTHLGETTEEAELAEQRQVGRADDVLGQPWNHQLPPSRVDRVGRGERRADAEGGLDDHGKHRRTEDAP